MSRALKSLIFTLLLGATMAPAQAAVGASAARLHLFGLEIPNSILTTWIVAIILLLVVRLAIGRKPTLVPSRGQAVIESLIGGVRDMIEPIVGKRTAPAALPLLLTLFVLDRKSVV